MSVGTAIRNPRSFLAGKWRALRALLVDPGTFYDRREASASIRYEVIVVAVIGLVGTAAVFFTARALLEPFSTSPTGEGTRIASNIALLVRARAAQPLVGVFIVWVLLAAGFYALSWLYSDQGGFFQVFRNTAWGLVPLFFVNLLLAIGHVAASWNLDPETEVPVATDTETVDFFYSQVTEDPVLIAAQLIGLVIVIWSWYICSYGVADARDIPVSDAYKVAAVPMAVYILYMLNNYLGTAGIL